MPYNDKEKAKEYRKQHYLNNKQAYRDSVQRQRNKFRDFLQDYKKTLKCEICNENHISCLDFHHRNPDEKEFKIASMISSCRNKEKFLEEIKKCQVLCSNCHRKLHWNEKENCPHSSVAEQSSSKGQVEGASPSEGTT